MDNYSNYRTGFPRQMLSDKQKTVEWRKQCVAWAANRSFLTYQPITKSCIQKRINYDLLEGKLNMPDLQLVLNPYKLDAEFIPDNIQHYPIMNSKLNVLRGEEAKRVFDFRVVVTNPLSRKFSIIFHSFVAQSFLALIIRGRPNWSFRTSISV